MKKATLLKDGTVISENVCIADNIFTRFMGLMFRKSIENDYVLHITPCNQIHMFNMRFPIDVVYLSAQGEVVKIDENVKPNRICKTVRKAKSVLEMNSFTAKKFGIKEGDSIQIQARGSI